MSAVDDDAGAGGMDLLHIETLKKEVQDMSLGVIVASNREFYDELANHSVEVYRNVARNPTGQSIAGKDLEELVRLSKDKVTLVMDEFYSWSVRITYIRSSTPDPVCAHRYQYPDDPKDLGTTLSAAEYVEDVEEDPVIIINGLTKGWRYVAM